VVGRDAGEAFRGDGYENGIVLGKHSSRYCLEIGLDELAYSPSKEDVAVIGIDRLEALHTKHEPEGLHHALRVGDIPTPGERAPLEGIRVDVGAERPGVERGKKNFIQVFRAVVLVRVDKLTVEHSPKRSVGHHVQIDVGEGERDVVLNCSVGGNAHLGVIFVETPDFLHRLGIELASVDHTHRHLVLLPARRHHRSGLNSSPGQDSEVRWQQG